jgi:hypothetical protein
MDYIAAGNYLEHCNASGNEIGIASTDVFGINVVDAIRGLLDDMVFAPAPCKFEGDVQASDDPIRILLCSPAQFNKFSQEATFRTYQANAMARAASSKTLDLFRGSNVALWQGILVKMPKPIRFYAGDPINWCASATSSTETTTDLVPAAFSTTYAVDRAVLLGAQALGQALGKHAKSGVPMFWSEKELDHGDKVEILAGKIDGMSKFRFDIDFGAEGIQPTDFGTIAIDTVVRIAN